MWNFFFIGEIIKKQKRMIIYKGLNRFLFLVDKDLFRWWNLYKCLKIEWFAVNILFRLVTFVVWSRVIKDYIIFQPCVLTFFHSSSNQSQFIYIFTADHSIFKQIIISRAANNNTSSKRNALTSQSPLGLLYKNVYFKCFFESIFRLNIKWLLLW